MNFSCVSGKSIIIGKKYVLPFGCRLSINEGIIHVNGEPYGDATPESSEKKTTVVFQNCTIGTFEIEGVKKIKISNSEINDLKTSHGNVKISKDSKINDVTVVLGNVCCGDVSGGVKVSSGDIKAHNIHGGCTVNTSSTKRRRGFVTKINNRRAKRVDLKRDLGDGGLD